MKGLLKFIKGSLITIWLFLAVFSLICLLSMNKFMVSELGDYSLFIVDNKSLEPNFKKNDIVIVPKALENEYNVDDFAFFYFGNKETVSYINLGQIKSVEKVDRAEDTFTIDDLSISYGNMVGKANKTIVIHKLGLLLSILESKWGFMFLVILPTLYAIVYEIYMFVMIIKEDTKQQLKDNN